MSDLPKMRHPYSGMGLPREVFADPGRHGWYFRERKPDSVARYIRADLCPADPLADERVKRLVEALRPFAAAVYNDNGDVTISQGHITRRDWLHLRAALKEGW